MKFSQWKRVEVEEMGRKEQVMRIVETEVERTTFIASFENQKNDFSIMYVVLENNMKK